MAIKPTPLHDRFWKYVQKSDGCWLWTGATTNGGYGVIQSGPRPARIVRAHRLSYEMHFGPFDESLDVCHRCDNPRCVRPDHLFVGTAKTNVADMVAKGRASSGGVRGERHGRAKLTEAQVLAIRAAYASGTTSQRQLARDYAVDRGTIRFIVMRKHWTHV